MCWHVICKNSPCSNYLKTHRCFEAFDQSIDEGNDETTLRSCPKSQEVRAGRCSTCILVEGAIGELEVLVLFGDEADDSADGAVQLERKGWEDKKSDDERSPGKLDLSGMSRKQVGLVEGMVHTMRGGVELGEEDIKEVKGAEEGCDFRHGEAAADRLIKTTK